MTTESNENASARAATQPETPALAGAETPAVAKAPDAAARSAQTSGGGANEAEGEDEEDTVLMSEVLQHDAMMNETADAVLGSCSDTNCSYPMGYMRQALYACLTCTPEAEAKPETRAGVCLACSYNCHEGHDLVELYTKRAFRCDCGNSKFPSDNPCKLETDKARANERNVYSQNFWGKYCTCHRPYPDPERTTEEVMVQCVVCEDWLHDEHILPPVSTADNAVAKDSDVVRSIPEHFDELICLECMRKHPFLMAYTLGDQEEEGGGDEANAGAAECSLKPRLRLLMPHATEDVDPESVPSTIARPTFWSTEWREDICQCSACVSLLERHGVAFLADVDDSLHAYESNSRARAAENEERAASSLTQSMSHEQKIEMGMAYHHMKSNLQQFLGGFAASGKTLRTEDVQGFFDGLKQSYKRQRTGDD